MRGEYVEEKFATANAALMQTSQKTFHYATLNLPAFQICMYTCVVLIMWFGGNMILGGALQVGELTGFLSYVLQVMNSLMMLSNVFLLVTRSLASASRVSEVLDESIAFSSPEDAVEEVPDGSVDFENVSFKYHEDAREYALSGVNLHIPAGQTVGVLGGTGSAKSTLVQLIPRPLRRHRRRRARRRPRCAGIRPPRPARRGGHRPAEKRAFFRHCAR